MGGDRRQRTRRRQPGELAAEALHAPALLIDRHQQRRLTQAVDVGQQGLQLLRRLEVASEQDHAADLGVTQDLPLFGGERQAAYAQHDRSQGHGHP